MAALSALQGGVLWRRVSGSLGAYREAALLGHVAVLCLTFPYAELGCDLFSPLPPTGLDTVPPSSLHKSCGVGGRLQISTRGPWNPGPGAVCLEDIVCCLPYTFPLWLRPRTPDQEAPHSLLQCLTVSVSQRSRRSVAPLGFCWKEIPPCPYWVWT